jgi:hypothetical protein
VPDVEVAATTWRGIDALAALVGTYCWVEERIFEVAGTWATGTSGAPSDRIDPERRVWCAGVSRRHGLLAARWAERLPVRAGIDRAALVTPPIGPLAEAFDVLHAAPDADSGVAALVDTVLPGVQAVYDSHRRAPNPISEASVLEVLAGAHRELAVEIRAGRALPGSPATG